MPITRFTPLEAPVLDPRNEAELVEMAIARVFLASGGRINDFSTSSPVRSLIEGQAFAAAEHLFWCNQFLEAVSIQVLQIAGVQRRLGTASQTRLTFTLTAPLAGPFTIPQGYLVKDGSGRIGFATDAVLVIPAGQTSGVVSATCTELGKKGDVGAYSLVQLTQPLAFLQSVTNIQGATGGTDPETVEETKARGFAALRRRGLVSADDYEQETKNLLGLGSVAKCIGNRAPDRISYQLGAAHLFCLNPDGSLLNEAQIESLKLALQRRTFVAARVQISNVDVVELNAYVICAMVPGTNPQVTGATIWRSLQSYLQPGKLPLGETIVLKELEYLARNANGVEYVQSVSLGRHLQPRYGTNLQLPYDFSAAKLRSLTVELVDGSQSYAYNFGSQ
jgi:hypothetical protein